jgi:signal peptidase II
MTPKLRVFLGAFLLTLPVDQATKIWVDHSLTYADRVTVIDGFFYLTHVRNPGAAFGLFTDGPVEIRLGIFIGVTLVAIGIIFSFFRRLAPGDRLSALALGMILGGAGGNLIDRVFRGEVVDFLHFRLWGGYTWPDFNLADTWIVIGVALLLLELLAVEGESRGESARTEPGTPS